MRALANDQRINGVSYGWERARNESPSVQRVNGAVVRRNLANRPAGASTDLNPGELGFSTRWAGDGGAQKISILTDVQGPDETGITTAIRKTWTVIGKGLSDVAFAHASSGVNGYPVTPGEVYTVSSYWRVSRSQINILQSKTSCVLVNSSGKNTGTVNGSNYTGPIVADEWNLVYTTVTVPEGISFIVPYMNVSFLLRDNTSLQVGDTLDATGLLVEKPPVLRPYFDGDTQVNAETINRVTNL